MSECEESIPLLQDELDKRVRFIDEYLALSESHMVDFFVWDHWNKLVHPEAQKQLLQCDDDDLFSVKTMLERHLFSDIEETSTTDYAIGNLTRYFSRAKECAIEDSPFCCDASQLEHRLGIHEMGDTETATKNCGDAQSLVSTKEYMCNKKSHEVEEMSYLVNSMCRYRGLSHVLDMGSGKGYLGTYLSLRYGLEVVGVDCSKSNSSSALLRSKKFLKYWNAHLKNKTDAKLQNGDMKYQPVTVYVDSDTDVNFLFVNDGENEKGTGMQEQMMLTALHACGNLSSTALRTFVSRPEIESTCIIGCCYHILTSDEDESTEKGFPMSKYLLEKNVTLRRNTRMLGLKAPDRIQSTDTKTMEEKSIRSLFYRAVLSIILSKEFGLDSSSKELRVGKEYAKSKDFVDYVRRSLRRLKLPSEGIMSITDEKINSYLQSVESLRKTLLAFSMLREAFGPAVEALILLDKLLYLKEQASSLSPMDSYLVRLFDPVKSPRCYALVAVKNPVSS